MTDRSYRYVTLDVFTAQRFGGNPLAVLPEAEGLSDAEMQAIAREFNFSETTFVLPPANPTHTARVRIFTPTKEMPFAGHPNIGTATVLAWERLARGEALPQPFLFEEVAGLVPVAVRVEGGAVLDAELRAPLPLSRLAMLDPAGLATCLSLGAEDVVTAAHRPQVVSVGAPFVVVELSGLEALGRIRPNPVAWDAVLPRDGASAIYAYVRMSRDTLRARMFTRSLYEDPATGSATAAATALLLALFGEARIALTVHQGVEMGRPSLLQATAWRDGKGVAAGVAGGCVPVMQGRLRL
ncbi:PhzF family phenazine biosynthesis isomerase [Pseudoroseomonas wenyumeiae]|uniref:PhzF family phenazine biosynthesis isomerase n=1 Tax=Teichococcus wenyumeiae TaxID=2478470 RepID=A0A3A9J994_9PROT|nr:PhzF family phenazine biosynthesis protein [Pseudoroseomonas wenyumeiae]RKK02620.1 PhzF family phenazine biosynthesis protein [Pseudoroseomonas wenyumeiae]RMI15378.1 PhzF family phenazine biosynthesis isomerase [Pseudoroseomonas wenyumeiae]